MLNFVLCDDNVNVLNRLSKILDSLFIQHNYEAQITYQSTDAKDILSFVKNNPVNVLILDINLNSPISGIDIAKSVRDYNKEIYIIFTTAHLEYVMIAYKVKTFDYLPKPITKERLEETVIRLFNDIQNDPVRYINIGNKNSTLVRQDDINYIKKDGMRLIFQTNSKQYVTYNSFNKIQDCLPDNFVRCHKSYIANVNKIVNIESNSNTILFDKDQCYIGPKYKSNFMEVLNYGNFPINLAKLNYT